MKSAILAALLFAFGLLIGFYIGAVMVTDSPAHAYVTCNKQHCFVSYNGYKYIFNLSNRL